MRSMVEGFFLARRPLHRAAPKAQFILSAAAGGVEGRGPPPPEIRGRNHGGPAWPARPGAASLESGKAVVPLTSSIANREVTFLMSIPAISRR